LLIILFVTGVCPYECEMFGTSCVHHKCTRLDPSLPCDMEGCVLYVSQCVVDPCFTDSPPTSSSDCKSECLFVEGSMIFNLYIYKYSIKNYIIFSTLFLNNLL
jgi:hypothetical protein